MTEARTPGVVANTRRKNGAVRDVRRMRGLDLASEMLGSHVALAAALGIGVGLLRQKIAAERPVRDEELRLTATALSARARQAGELAERLLALMGDHA